MWVGIFKVLKNCFQFMGGYLNCDLYSKLLFNFTYTDVLSDNCLGKVVIKSAGIQSTVQCPPFCWLFGKGSVSLKGITGENVRFSSWFKSNVHASCCSKAMLLANVWLGTLSTERFQPQTGLEKVSYLLVLVTWDGKCKKVHYEICRFFSSCEEVHSSWPADKWIFHPWQVKHGSHCFTDCIGLCKQLWSVHFVTKSVLL